MRYLKNLAIVSAVTSMLAACAGSQNGSNTEAESVQDPFQERTVAEAPAPAAAEPEETTVLPNILVMPANTGKGISEIQVIQQNPMSRAMMEAVNEYLTKKQYDVKSLEGQADLDNVVQMQNDIAETDEDLSYLASLAIGADVYIKFSGNVNPNAIAVELNAYESSTARLLGSEAVHEDDCGGNDRAALAACLHDAARRAMPQLEKKIQAYWKQDKEQGEQYKIIMNIKGAFDEEDIEDLHDDIVTGLKQSFNRVTVNVMTAKTIDLIVYANPKEFDDAQSIYSFIRKLLKEKAQTKKVNVTRKLILMDIN